jgi:hypothetical protein
MRPIDKRTFMAAFTGFVAGAAFILGCLLDLEDSGSGGPGTAGAAPNDPVTCSQWQVERKPVGFSVQEFDPGWEPFAAAQKVDEHDSIVFVRRCVH